jgi:hypothetical protein
MRVSGGERMGHFQWATSSPEQGEPFLFLMVAERSSPSRVRFAPLNNGAPLTAPGRSHTNLPVKKERLHLKGWSYYRRHNGPFFHRYRHNIYGSGKSSKLSSRQGSYECCAWLPSSI